MPPINPPSTQSKTYNFKAQSANDVLIDETDVNSFIGYCYIDANLSGKQIEAQILDGDGVTWQQFQVVIFSNNSLFIIQFDQNTNVSFNIIPTSIKIRIITDDILPSNASGKIVLVYQ